MFCCGPAPVKAIKDRRIDLFYDIPFVYAEVNADVHTIVVSEGRVVSHGRDTEKVGSLICTKAICFPRLQNITGDYKNTKSMNQKLHSWSGIIFILKKLRCSHFLSIFTLQARLHQEVPQCQRTQHRAEVILKFDWINEICHLCKQKHVISCPGFLHVYSADSSTGVMVFLILDKAPVAGEPVRFTVKVINKHRVAKMMKIHLNAQTKEYNHSPLDTFWETHGALQLAPNEGKFTFNSSTDSKFHLCWTVEV